MLVLTRKQQQQIQIGENITLTILKVKGQSVRVGVEAPQGIRILRGELVATADLAEEVSEELPASGSDELPSELDRPTCAEVAPEASHSALRRVSPSRPTAALAPLPR